MRSKILLIGGVALLAYVIGTRTPRIQVKNRESVGHQIVRLWNDPRAKKQRQKNAEKRAKALGKVAKQKRRSAEKRAKALADRAGTTFRQLRK